MKRSNPILFYAALAVFVGLAVAVTIFALTPAALAAPLSPEALQPAPIDGRVVVPWGDWAASLIVGGSGTIVLGAAGWALRRLPGPLYWALQQSRVDRLLEAAVAYGVNRVAGAARGRALTVPVGNAVIERAAEYAVRHAPALVEQLGGLQALRDRLLARLDLEATAGDVVPGARLPS